MKKRFLRIASFVLALVISLSVLCSCSFGRHESEPEQPRASFTGTEEGYVYYNTDDRCAAWEKDIIFLAVKYLTEHPYLADRKFYINTAVVGSNFNEVELQYSNLLYNEEMRSAFIDEINLLIPQIPELTDSDILHELQRIVAALADCHSDVSLPKTQFLPFTFVPFFEDDGVSFYAVETTYKHSDLLFCKLIAINSIPVEEIVQRLLPYISYEGEGWAYEIMSYYTEMLTGKNTLQKIGVMGQSEDEVVLTFETEDGNVDRTQKMLTYDEYMRADTVGEFIEYCNIPLYRYWYERCYWYEVFEEEKCLYVHFEHVYEDYYQTMNGFIGELNAVLRDAESPMKLIIDFRNNTGGNTMLPTSYLIEVINRYETDGIYILINSKTASAAVLASYKFSKNLDGAVLVGTPAAQFANSFGNAETHIMPNSGAEFRVSSEYFMSDPECSDKALMPDIVLHQTVEDYKNGVDTVLEYVLDLD